MVLTFFNKICIKLHKSRTLIIQIFFFGLFLHKNLLFFILHIYILKYSQITNFTQLFINIIIFQILIIFLSSRIYNN